MIQTIKENKNRFIFLWVILFTILILLYVILEQNKSIELVNKELAKEQSKQSNADIITKAIIDRWVDITLTAKQITELESVRSKLELEVSCWKNQMNRLVDWLEYNLQYCKDENNLKKFKEGLE